MKKLTLRQTDKLFDGLACDVYDKFIEDAIIAYSRLFPDRCDEKIFDHAMYDKVRERLMIELQIRYAEARGEANVEKRFKKTTSKRAVAK
jgi:hypothetical protein